MRDKRNHTDIYKLLNSRMKALCLRARELSKEFPGLTREQEERQVDRLIDELLDSVVKKLTKEEPDPDGKKRLEKDAKELREYAKKLKAKYLRS